MLAWPAMAGDFHRAEVFGGYQYTHVGMPGAGANGLNLAVTGYPAKWLGLTGDFSAAYHSTFGADLKAYTYTFGPTVVHRGERVSPYAHVLLGGFHASAEAFGFGGGLNGFAMLAGGGVDVHVAGPVAVRLVQADWILWNSSGATEKKNARISTGIVLRFD